MKEIFIILACVPLYVLNSFCDKYASMQSSSANNAKYNAMKFLIGTGILFPFFLVDGLPRFQFGAVVCGILCGVLYVLGKGAILLGYEKTSVSFMTLCHSAGMIVPCVMGHFLWNEALGAVSLIGILLTVVSILLLKNAPKAGKRLTPSGILAGIAVFVSSGGVMVMQKLMGMYFADESISAYNFYSFAVSGLIMLVLVAFSKQKTAFTTEKTHLLKRTLFCAAGSAIALCVISLVMTGLAGAVPSVVLFPLFNGSGIIFVCIGSVFAFREKMSFKQLIGLFVGVAGLCIVNL